MSEQTHSENLKKQQHGHRLKNHLNKARDVGQKLALFSYVNPFMDWLFGIAIILAILKDILDFVGVGSLPGIGTVITLIVSLSIAFVMLLTGSASKIKISKTGRKFMVLIGGTIVEMIFGIDFAPIETTMAVYIFYSTLKSRQEAAQEDSLKQGTHHPAAA
ncbi:MAG: hypothetical protein WC238_04430 [Parcubacteria group bacterium]|jgi:hypothetical protein